MTDFRLKVFLSVAHHLSFTKASKELFISQPAISKHIQELESDFKARLFERKSNSIALTLAGKLLLQHAEGIIDKYKELEYAMHQLHGELVGELKLGASSTISQYVLPPLLAKFTSLNPQIKVSLLSGNTREIEDALENHEIDLGFIEGNYRRSHLKYTLLLADELVLIANPQAKIGSKIKLEDLCQYPLVLREQGSGTLDVIQEVLESGHIYLKDLNIPLHLGSTESIKLFVQNSDALGIVSVRAVQSDILLGRLREVRIENVAFNREFCQVSLQGESSGLSVEFMKFVDKYKDKL
ncbi:LysR family transcriptional regulator [Bacteroides propionicifaciens]|uniref:LysR family transcriptional regulator n=1 Tax=Bacteroides propionicifaciens TaxID=392838 RepID=UPI000378799C|nr:LysR family transcriptional regulator [Bacteroides propionicifaciens]